MIRGYLKEDICVFLGCLEDAGKVKQTRLLEEQARPESTFIHNTIDSRR